MATKKTKKDFYEKLKSVVEASAGYEEKKELLIFLQHEMELLEKKKASAKPTATQKMNEILKENLQVALASLAKPATVTEILQSDPTAFSSITCQKASALLNAMVKEGYVTKVTEKKKSYFFLP